jgi:hypothetical protein
MCNMIGGIIYLNLNYQIDTKDLDLVQYLKKISNTEKYNPKWIFIFNKTRVKCTGIYDLIKKV